ncbi:MAG: lipid-A-disaccharide synthase [Cyclobacteriaceae bacterium]|nr:MAG: lipid-A-disaccharide synthase [Cyclobacteriaceae bacterium]
MKLYFIAGERSGDLHGGNLIRALKSLQPNLIIRGFGGDAMQQAGMELVVHYRHLALMGFGEVLRHLGTIRQNLNRCQADILNFKPYALVLIDFAGFNLRMARFAKSHGIMVFWYISPKVWAWNNRRARRLKAFVDRMFVILPFEKDFFLHYGWKVDYVGNPVIDAINTFTFNETFLQEHNLPNTYIALLPGSRRQEVQHMAPVLAQVAARFPEHNFVVPQVDNLDDAAYHTLMRQSNIRVLKAPAYDILRHARAAVVTSGTATLETALLRVPQVVVYRTGWLSYCLGKWLIRVPFISLVNLIAGKAVVRELIQHQANVVNISNELSCLMNDEAYRQTILAGYDEVRQALGNEPASKRTAELMLNYLSKKDTAR